MREVDLISRAYQRTTRCAFCIDIREKTIPLRRNLETEARKAGSARLSEREEEPREIILITKFNVAK